jgi:guanosine-3',5'-bis(diphosphate) 3'-pyrophosphohydrolase
MTNLITRARNFAHRAHDSIKQIRKYTFEPYWVHTDEVADILTLALINNPTFLAPRDAIVTIAGAHLHDYKEDVVTKLKEQNRLAELEAFEAEYVTFGSGVDSIVNQLTDEFTKENYPKLNRAQRKALERERIANDSVAAKSAKLADLISNTKSIVEHDKDFARTYIREKLVLLEVLGDGEPSLYAEALRIAQEAAVALDLREFRK